MSIKNECGFVRLAYDDAFGNGRIERDFYVACSDGIRYVYEAGGRQVCKSLKCSGPTLMARAETLESVIRAEYRAMRREEKLMRQRF